MLKLRNRIKNEKGFTLVELMVVIAIIGILATIGLMKMQDATAAANGAKIVADLRTIDSAIVMAQATGQTISTGAIATPVLDYLDSTPTPPNSGYYYTKGTGKAAILSADNIYKITDTNGVLHATYNSHNVTYFTNNQTTSSQ